MRLWRKMLRSTKGRIALGVMACYAAWQVFLSLAAPAKIAPGFPADRERVNAIVRLPFAPERFHVLVFQRYGRVSGTGEDSGELRGVRRADLSAVARPYWVRRVEPMPTGG